MFSWLKSLFFKHADLNNDSKVDLKDVKIAATRLADVNNDGVVDFKDAAEVVKKVRKPRKKKTEV